jgi:hypothetical protein
MKPYIVAALLGIVVVHAAQTAVLTVEPPNAAGQVAISLDTQGQDINAFSAHLSFNPAEFSISGVNEGGSIIDLWITPPTFSNSLGTLDLSGIVPGGIDTASGTIATIAIVPEENVLSGGFQVTSATVLLDDGRGTPAELSVESGPFAIATTSFAPAPFAVDLQPPNPFTPEIARDPSIFNDQYFLSFAATDEGSGINHYEVLEVPTRSGGSKSSGWQVTQSPYLLKDQTLSSNIYVRAVDNAGNFRVAEVSAEHSAAASASLWARVFYVALGCAIIMVFLAAFFIMRRKRKLT